MSRCGYVHLTTTKNSGPLGEPLLLVPLRKNEGGKGWREHPLVQSLSMKGYSDDGIQTTRFCSAHPCVIGRLSAARSLLSACRAYPRPFICARVGAGDLRRWWPSFH